MLHGNSQRICKSCWIDVEPLHMRKYDWTTIAGNIETWPKNEIWWLNPCKFHVVVWDPCAVFSLFAMPHPRHLFIGVAEQCPNWRMGQSWHDALPFCHCWALPRCFLAREITAHHHQHCALVAYLQSAVWHGKWHESFIMNLYSTTLW